MAPLTGTVYERECVRCNLCGEVFTAETPAEVGQEKYDASVSAMIGILKFGYGIPYDRLGRMQKVLGIPMPPSTQYEILEEDAIALKPIHKEMLRRVAQAAVIHTDDTSMKILKVKRDPEDNRTGLFTTGIVGVASDHKIGLFFTGTKHSGENLAAVLEERAAELESPVLMCDALSWNTSKLKAPGAVVLAHCLAHGRRRFTDIAVNFPEACLHVLGELAKVYGHDQTTRQQKMGPTERLKYHREHSRPIMKNLDTWIDLQLEGSDEVPPTCEPNSRLGDALKYLKKHWKPLTLFLRDGKAPLDNNVCERAIKKAVLNRKNAMFYKTINGAQVGDLYMSIIHTCELNGVNPFDYLVTLGQQSPEELSDNAAAWMPWNYKCRLEAGTLPTDEKKQHYARLPKAHIAPTISRLKAQWALEHEAWTKRSLAKKRYVYWWADGVHFNIRGDDARSCILVVIGVTETGHKEFIAIEEGLRESEQSWLEVLNGIKANGLVTGPELAVGDGALGFWKALVKVFGETRHQRCWVHKTANVLNKLPKTSQPKAKESIHQIWMAETREKAIKAFDTFLVTYEAKYPKAAKCLAEDRDKLLAFYDFPAQHWAHIRTTNPIESTFATVRLRTAKTRGCVSRKTILSMVYKLGLSAQTRWRKLRGFNHLADVIQGVKFQDGVRLETSQDKKNDEREADRVAV